MKIKFFKKEKNFKKESSKFNLNFYWGLAIGLMLVITFLSFLFGYVLFTRLNKEFVVSSNDTNSQLEIIKKQRIDKVLEYFSAHEKKSNEIKNSPVPVVDPSL